MRGRVRQRREADESGPLTLAIDIGGTGLKASVLGRDGGMIAAPARIATPHPALPERVLDDLRELAAGLPPFDRISAGFPGVVRHGRIMTAPHLGTADWHGFDLAAALEKALGKPARVLNDADVQGLGVVSGHGLECVLTFGTGLGSALFQDGVLGPHLELSQHPIRKKKTYDVYLGDAALRAKGRKRWNRRVARAIEIVRRLVNFDILYLGGGNARKLRLDLPPDIRIVDNSAGITGGIRLWDERHDPHFAPARPARPAVVAEPSR